MHALRPIAVLTVVATLSACATPQGGGEFPDPYEEQNRQVHELNVALDRALVGPASQVYGGVIPAPVRLGVTNFASNLTLPGTVVNDLLQAKIGDAFANAGRFVLNTVAGLGGIFDPASVIGLDERRTDFGETLHVWGVGEGNYIELPVLGPSTERDFVGMLVDFAMNPTWLLHHPESHIATGVAVTAKLGQRYQYSDTIDSILYESADSYAQARLLYLQSRRFQLGGDDELTYSDPYSDPYADPYADPYEATDAQ